MKKVINGRYIIEKELGKGGFTRPMKKVIEGRYIIKKELGKGGFARVYLALDKNLNRLVAIKIINQKDLCLFYSNGSLIKILVPMFQDEARNYAALKHPNVVEIYDIFEVDGMPHIVMEYLNGKPLGKWRSGKQPSLPEIITIIRQFAAGLAHIHHNGLIHRDLSAGNVFVEEDAEGHIKVTLIDLGLAQPHGFSRHPTHCTAAYASRNVAAQGAQLTEQDDLHAFAVLTYELCAQALPYEARDHTAILKEILLKGPTFRFPNAPFNQVAGELKAALDRACFPDRCSPYEHATEMASCIISILETIQPQTFSEFDTVEVKPRPEKFKIPAPLSPTAMSGEASEAKTVAVHSGGSGGFNTGQNGMRLKPRALGTFVLAVALLLSACIGLVLVGDVVVETISEIYGRDETDSEENVGHLPEHELPGLEAVPEPMPQTKTEPGVVRDGNNATESKAEPISKTSRSSPSSVGQDVKPAPGVPGRSASSIIPIEDAAFKAYLVAEFDENGDGDIDRREARGIKVIKTPEQQYPDPKITNKINTGIADITPVRHFTRLKILDIRRNRLTQLPNLPPGLVELNIEGNKITALTGLPKSLEKLNISNNPIVFVEDLPAGLKTLIAESCHMKALLFPPQSALETLNLRDNDLRSLPDELPKRLKSLNIDHNDLEALPADLPHTLKKLSAVGNDLYQLPELNDRLEFLDVSDNFLREITQLSWNLIDLVCRNNQIVSLPAELPLKLERLYIEGNLVEVLPRISDLHQLREIQCYNNRLTRDSCGTIQRLLLEKVRVYYTPQAETQLDCP